MNLETQIFFLNTEHRKIFDKCLGVFQNLDQGPEGALKTVFAKHFFFLTLFYLLNLLIRD